MARKRGVFGWENTLLQCLKAKRETGDRKEAKLGERDPGQVPGVGGRQPQRRRCGWESSAKTKQVNKTHMISPGTPSSSSARVRRVNQPTAEPLAEGSGPAGLA